MPKSLKGRSKRAIRSHKGGRTAQFPRARLTPEVRAMLDTILAERKLSAADWVTQVIERECQLVVSQPA